MSEEKAILIKIKNCSHPGNPFKLAIRLKYPKYYINSSQDNLQYSNEISKNLKNLESQINYNSKILESKYPHFLDLNSKDNILYHAEKIEFFTKLTNLEKDKYINQIKQLSSNHNSDNTNIVNLKEHRSTNNQIQNNDITPDTKVTFDEYKKLLKLKYLQYNINGSNDKSQYDRLLNEFRNSPQINNTNTENNNTVSQISDNNSENDDSNLTAYQKLKIKFIEFEESCRLKYPSYNKKKSKDRHHYILQTSTYISKEISKILKKDQQLIDLKSSLKSKYPNFHINQSTDNISYASEINNLYQVKQNELKNLIKVEKNEKNLISHLNTQFLKLKISSSVPTRVIKRPIYIDIGCRSKGISLIHEILACLPEDIGLLGCGLAEIPKIFVSQQQYQLYFKPILFEELRTHITQSLEVHGGKMDQESKFMDLTKISNHPLNVDYQDEARDILTLKFRQKISNKKYIPLLNPSDLVLLSICDHSKKIYYIFGHVGNSVSDIYDKKKNIFKKYIRGNISLQRSKETDHIIDLINSNQQDLMVLQIKFRKIENLMTFIREFKALNRINNHIHSKFLLSPSLEFFRKIRDSSNSYSIPPLLMRKLTLNDSQLNAIKESLFPTGINLIQGPPGTGKTSVIISLISIFLAINPNFKILISAPSHTAVDEVARRIIKNQIYNDKGILFKPRMVRTGRIEAISEDIHEICLNKDHFLSYQDKIRLTQSSQIIFSTLAGAGADIVFRYSKPDVIIVDESTQSNEATSIIPFSLSKKIILIGDPVQLPPTVISDVCKRFNFDRSLFERLAFELPRSLLTVQYRMHPLISKFPSNEFYKGAIKDGENVQLYNQPFYNNPKYKAIHYYNVSDSKEETQNKSIKNTLEIKLVFALIKKLVQEYPTTKSMSWGIITPYKLQKKEIDDAKKTFNEAFDVKVNTVDGFQGGEKDIIIFSCVRQSRIGFLGDKRRINVGITRAKYGLFIIGNLNLLNQDPTWRKYINYLNSNKSLSTMDEQGIKAMENQIQKYDLDNPEGLITINEEDDDDYDDYDDFLKNPYKSEFGDDENEDDSENEDESILEGNGFSKKSILQYRSSLKPYNDSDIIKTVFLNISNEYLITIYQGNLTTEENIKMKFESFNKLKGILLKDPSNKSLELFGSTLHQISLNSGDIDVCLFTSKTDNVVEIIQSTHNHLTKSSYNEIIDLNRARVPIIKFKDSSFSYDMSFNMSNGILNSYLMMHYSHIDKRSKQLMLLIKIWAKKKNINDASQHTLSSYAYLNMVIHYLQAIKPPVLPNLQENGCKISLQELKDEKFSKRYSTFRSNNQLTISQLFYGFFYFYSRFNFKSNLVSIRLGNTSPITIASKEFTRSYTKSPICIEDPFDINFNIGRTVSPEKFKTILYEIQITEEKLKSFGLEYLKSLF